MAKGRVCLTLMSSGAPPRESSDVPERKYLHVLGTDVGPELASLEALPPKVATVLQIDGHESHGIISQSILSHALDLWLNDNLAEIGRV